MKYILAIDPGSTESGFVLWGGQSNSSPTKFGKVENREIIKELGRMFYRFDLVIERVASYGMPVGKTTFDTVEWIGRFTQNFIDLGHYEKDVYYYTRAEIKMLNCHKVQGVNDSVLRQRMIDLYAPDTRNYGKGSKDDPGFFYGFKSDVWQAFALASTHKMSEQYNGGVYAE